MPCFQCARRLSCLDKDARHDPGGGIERGVGRCEDEHGNPAQPGSEDQSGRARETLSPARKAETMRSASSARRAIGPDLDGTECQNAFDGPISTNRAADCRPPPIRSTGRKLHPRSCRRSRRFLSICSLSWGVIQNMAKCAQRLLITRNSLLGIIFCSAAQSSTGKNMSCENGIT